MKFRDIALKFNWFSDEIFDLDVESMIIFEDFPNTIEIYGVLKGKRVYVIINMKKSRLKIKEIMDDPAIKQSL